MDRFMLEKRFIEIVERCYASLEDPCCLEEAHDLIGQSIGADAGDIVTEASFSNSIETHGSFGFDPDFLKNYDSEFLGKNPWAENLALLSRNRFHTDAEDSPDFARSAYFNEWVRPQGFHHSVGAILNEDAGQVTWVGYVRNAGRTPFEAEIAFLGRLLPHLRRTVSLSNRISCLHGEWASLSAVLSALKLPVLVVDGAQKVVFLNEAAERFLRRSRQVGTTRSGVLTATGAAGERLRVALDRAARILDRADMPPDRTILVEDDREAVAATVIPLCGWQTATVPAGRAAVVLCRFDPETMPDLSAFAARHGLTETETELARHIACGKGVADFAQQKGIAASTVRWHLKNLEAKAGVSRVEQLVAAIHASILPVANGATEAVIHRLGGDPSLS
ncbi:LuxR C-terminal-related transcriptional regulator [Ostreiculturibacter nitratireducens]|uniref:LuxR C-terminal-related transcriptional regulator n=1 Tax=Ostreiculturibacter nitratireducens TaxID=3075226 RepID=UPI0031B5B192